MVRAFPSETWFKGEGKGMLIAVTGSRSQFCWRGQLLFDHPIVMTTREELQAHVQSLRENRGSDADGTS